MSAIDQGLLAELLALESDLRESDWDVRPYLAPGRERGGISLELRAAGLTPHPAVVTWFAWHDGYVAGAERNPGVPVWWPMSLDQALRDRNACEFGHEPWQWHPDWLPIAWAGGIPRLVVNCGPSSDAGQVRIVATDEGLFSDTYRPRFASISDLVKAWRTALAKQAVVRPENGIWGPGPTRDDRRSYGDAGLV